MKDQNSFEIISVEKKLTEAEQISWRLRLRALAKLNGIASICLDDEGMFIEYDTLSQNRQSIQDSLKKLEFPAKY